MKKKIQYRIWPLGKLNKKFIRPELNKIRKLGYSWKDPWDVVDIFEKKIAAFSGAKYAIACDCCSHGLFLVLKYLKAKGKIIIPKRTYVSVPAQIIHAGCKVVFKNIEWNGVYRLNPYPVWDFATRWTEGMFNGEFNVCSFQIKKRVPIGKGGVILTNDKKAYKWLNSARYDGRNFRKDYMKNDYKILGWHFYMTPEDAARGIILMDQTPKINDDTGGSSNYSDISKFKIFL
jgi:dTDP-4-amino-4,6-dideoxygalactose transaminase